METAMCWAVDLILSDAHYNYFILFLNQYKHASHMKRKAYASAHIELNMSYRCVLNVEVVHTNWLPYGFCCRSSSAERII